MERFVDKTAVVTGASAGIGKAIVKELLQKEVNVIGLARRIEKLEEMSEEFLAEPELYLGKFIPLKCDISDANEIREAFQWIGTNVGPVSILINNAGVLVPKSLFDLDEKSFDDTFGTNVKGLMLCSKEAIDMMIGSDSGSHIININSMLGHYLIQFGENLHFLYAVSKHTVTALSEALRREVTCKKAAIKISNVSPGIVETDFSAEETAMISENQKLQPEDVARACIAVLDTPSHVLISELTISGIHQMM